MDKLRQVARVRGLDGELHVELEKCHDRLDKLGHVWIPSRLEEALDELRELVLLVLNSRGETDLGAERTKTHFDRILTELSAHGFGNNDLRVTVEPLAVDAKEALFEQLKYLSESTHSQELPEPMSVLVHAEIGGKYLKLVRGVHSKMMHDDRPQGREGMSARAYLRKATLLLRTALLSVYSCKTILLVRGLHIDSSKFEALASWAKTFRGTVNEGLPAAEEGGESPQTYWQEVGDVVRADWAALKKAWEWVVEKFCELVHLPGDEQLLKLQSHPINSQHHLLTSHTNSHENMHSLSRISSRAAKRYGTTQWAWAQERQGRVF
ncbi:hypothetical protein Rt10032_c21g6488 [Rhodotorula toruloides]|uniref:Uncharacterized protein n=1 Tax=Rhodotorula toruloides TaxID=5286 RepID=A0A511KQ28_RHOTO|nr:hypothetical protein Rt10032_c21g6488 [Rhodotorula toruloides]